jgi:hypothetical protein
MTPEDILARPTRLLPQADREQYFSDGYLSVAQLVDETWMAQLRDVTSVFIEESRQVSSKDARFDHRCHRRSSDH